MVVQDPKKAEFLDQWCRAYHRSFNLKDNNERLAFYEALTEMGKFLTTNSQNGRLDLSLSSDGVSEFKVVVVPG